MTASAVGIVLDRGLNFGATWGWGLAAATLGALAWLLGRSSRLAVGVTIAVLAAFVALGAGWHHFRWSDLNADDLARRVKPDDPPVLARVRGIVLDVPNFRPGRFAEDAGSTRFLMNVRGVGEEGGWVRASGRILVLVAGDRRDLPAGSEVAALGDLAHVPPPSNPGEPDLRRHLRAEGVRLRLRVAAAGAVRPADSPAVYDWLNGFLGRARAECRRRLETAIDPAVAPLATALVLGRREAVDPDLNDAFNVTGTTHLLAISGLHLQALALALFVVLRCMFIPYRRSLIIVLLASVAYAILVGAAPSVVRSTTMTVVLCFGRLMNRESRSANLLALAALFTLAINPSFLFDAGCQLSFLAVAAILWGWPMAERVVDGLFRPRSALDRVIRVYEPRWPRLVRWTCRYLAKGVALSAVIWLATMPVSAWWFHQFSPLSILLNIPLVPLTSIGLIAGGLALVLSPLGVPWLVDPPAWICGWCLHSTEWLVRWGGRQEWGYAFVPSPPLWWVLGFLGLLVPAAMAGSLYRVLAQAAQSEAEDDADDFAAHPVDPAVVRLNRVGFTLLATWLVLGFLVVRRPFGPDRLEVEFLNVGHGLSACIRDRAGRTFLYDCGRLGDPEVGRRIVAPALWARGVRRIDAVILSHADADHYNGLVDILDRFPVGEVRIAPGFDAPDHPGARSAIDEVRRRGVPVRPFVRGDRWRLADGATLDVLHPPHDQPEGLADNDRCLVIALAWKGKRLLLTGDLERLGQVVLRGRDSGGYDAVLAPHHGAKAANSALFYQWARPSIVVVSQRPPLAGAEPSALPVGSDVRVFRTWEDGAVRVSWEGQDLIARGFLTSEPEPPNTR